jgi:hypothetical protein
MRKLFWATLMLALSIPGVTLAQPGSNGNSPDPRDYSSDLTQPTYVPQVEVKNGGVSVQYRRPVRTLVVRPVNEYRYIGSAKYPQLFGRDYSYYDGGAWGWRPGLRRW